MTKLHQCELPMLVLNDNREFLLCAPIADGANWKELFKSPAEVKYGVSWSIWTESGNRSAPCVKKEKEGWIHPPVDDASIAIVAPTTQSDTNRLVTMEVSNQAVDLKKIPKYRPNDDPRSRFAMFLV